MERITLRQWRDSDLEPYAAMNGDPDVMRYFPSVLSREQSQASLVRQRALIEQRGWGLWALDVNGAFAASRALPFPLSRLHSCRVSKRVGGFGANIGGEASRIEVPFKQLAYGFSVMKLAEIVSFTAAVNTPSRRLMERLGFVRDAASDFDHPSIPEGHELRHHVFYRKKL
jgi:RimJ/RimL family protein N-acetyltransferase